MPEIQFPGSCSAATEGDLRVYSPLLESGDLVTDRVTVRGTTYRPGYVVVIEVHSRDVLQVGVILSIVLRDTKVLFIVSLHNAARNRFRFFQSIPCNQAGIVCCQDLADYKPLVKKGNSISFPFILHHHLPTPLA
jgi:hypothetical protein